MSAEAHLDHAVVNSFLRGLDYPLDEEQLVELARANDVLGPYLAAFRSLPGREYESQEDVMDALRAKGVRLS